MFGLQTPPRVVKLQEKYNLNIVLLPIYTWTNTKTEKGRRDVSTSLANINTDNT